eukprot:6437922-Lingulodinium_polyedra.AAC.1
MPSRAPWLAAGAVGAPRVGAGGRHLARRRPAARPVFQQTPPTAPRLELAVVLVHPRAVGKLAVVLARPRAVAGLAVVL